MRTDAAIVSSLKEIEYEFQALKCMAGIMATMLDDVIGTTSRYDQNSRVQITNEDLDRLSFAWNDVANRAGRLERDFMIRLYPAEAPE